METPGLSFAHKLIECSRSVGRKISGRKISSSRLSTRKILKLAGNTPITVDGVSSGTRVVNGKAAAERRFDPQHREEVRVDHEAFRLDRAHRIEHVELNADVGRGLLERIHAIAPCRVVERRRRNIREPARLIELEHDREPIAVAIRQRAKQRRARKAEDRRVDADAERERGNRYGRKHRPGDQRTQRASHGDAAPLTWGWRTVAMKRWVGGPTPPSLPIRATAAPTPGKLGSAARA